MKTLWIASGIAAAVLLAAYSGNKSQQASTNSKEHTPETAPAIDATTAATISGKVTFSGTKPVMKIIDMSATPACEHAHKAPQRSEEVVVNDNGTLKYVFVWVKSGVPDRAWPVPTTPGVLDQAGCMYEPHVLGVMVNQPVKITNSDPTNHNIHPLPRTNREWNESQPPNGEPKLKRFTKQEVMIPVKCNIHPWMRAWIGVVSHPFFAVTGDNGTFEIKGLPPGTYTLEAWHERYGTRDVQVTLAPTEAKTVNFDYTATR